ncbi:MAG: hypothetical protein WC648_04700 [Candidatus Paceibacterota bacterium]|jgi:hypothetical protein
MNEIAVYQEPLTALALRAQVNLVQEVMQAVMKKDTHYGTIPGTPKPSLWKPGAEVLAATFRIAVSYKVEDLSTPDVVRYRVTAIGTHQTSGIIMGEGMGACSSGEEKYKWRKAVNAQEFANTAEDRRRIKYGKTYNVDQVRTDPADLDNTILKMACKRAQVAMTLNVTAASDIFTQDIEDLPEELRGQHEEEKPVAPEFLSDETFNTYKAKWIASIANGSKAALTVITWVNAQGNGKLTESQGNALIAATPKAPTQSNDDFVKDMEKAEGQSA